ncbi:MAG TPA: hypothetical protein VFI80_10150 [Burkholderiales bacterium]|nr:hypothetical protein [Burkholderiales bacterium]
MNAPLMALLRLIHILAAIFWLGATLTLAGFLLPAMRTGPSAGALWGAVMQRHRLQFWINISMTLAVLAGFALYGIDSATSSGAFARSTMGKVLGLGAVLAIAAAGVMGAISQPAGRKLAALGQRLEEGSVTTASATTEAEALQARISRGLTIASVLLLLSATTMAIARYL